MKTSSGERPAALGEEPQLARRSRQGGIRPRSADNDQRGDERAEVAILESAFHPAHRIPRQVDAAQAVAKGDRAARVACRLARLPAGREGVRLKMAGQFQQALDAVHSRDRLVDDHARRRPGREGPGQAGVLASRGGLQHSIEHLPIRQDQDHPVEQDDVLRMANAGDPLALQQLRQGADQSVVDYREVVLRRRVAGEEFLDEPVPRAALLVVRPRFEIKVEFLG